MRSPAPLGPSGFVRPFVITEGRTRPVVELRLETILVASSGAWLAVVDQERHRILDVCARPLSVAELAVTLGLAVGVVKVLAADLLDADLLEVAATGSGAVDVSLLVRILEGVRVL